VGGGWAAPTSCRAGDESFGHDSPPAHLIPKLAANESNVFFVYMRLHLPSFGIQGCGGGGSVRRRNALHEVGGRVLRA
jgi:hypothetical protein